MDASDLRTRILAADRLGDLDCARRLVKQWQNELTHHATTEEQIAVFRLTARVLRHRDDVGSLQEALAVAQYARRLARVSGYPSVGLAELEEAACLVALDRTDEGIGIARRYVDVDSPSISGWAWRIMGQAHVKKESFASAVAQLQNAIGEYRRGRDKHYEPVTRILLGKAFDRSGRLSDAYEVFKRDETFWNNAPGARRNAINYWLARAANEQHRGDIAAAMHSVNTARAKLSDTSGLVSERVEWQHRKAVCLAEWGQYEQAKRQIKYAKKSAAGLDEPLREVVPLRAVQPGIKTRWLSVMPAEEPALRTSVHQQIIDELAETSYQLTSEGISRYIDNYRYTHRPRDKRLSKTESLRRTVKSAIVHAQSLGLSDTATVDQLLKYVDLIQSIPGLERTEAEILGEVGAMLAKADAKFRIHAERLLRRCLVRLEHLQGLEILRGRAAIDLGTLLADKEKEEALDLMVQGLHDLDRERFEMTNRRFRHNWLDEYINPTYERAIELALDCQKMDLARDLIVFSRVSGVPTPIPSHTARGVRASDIPLLPMPTLIYIDQSESILGSDEKCKLR